MPTNTLSISLCLSVENSTPTVLILQEHTHVPPTPFTCACTLTRHTITNKTFAARFRCHF